MPSSYTTLNRFVLEAPGENLNTWGTILNNNMIAMADFAISGRTNMALSGPVTLTTANGTADQARSAILDFTSGSGGTVTIPALSHVYQVRNNTSGNVVFTTGSGATAAVEPGSLATVISDGTNVYRFTDAADVAACLAAANTYTDNAAFASASGVLPGQAGNAGKYLQTNGTSPSWVSLGNAASATALQTGRTIAMTGDITWTSPSFNGSSNVTAAATLANVNSNVGTFAGATITVNAKGQVTAASSGTGTSGHSLPYLDGVNTWSGAQNFTGTTPAFGGSPLALASSVTQVASDLAAAIIGPVQTAFGAANYNITAVDGGRQIVHGFEASGPTRVITIPSNASVPFPVGTKIEVINAGSVNNVSITINTDTLIWSPSGTTGSRTLSGWGAATLTKVNTTFWLITGAGLT